MPTRCALKEYIEHVRNREIYDPVLTFQLSNDFHVRRVIRNYLPSDEESEHCATLLQWDNIYYQPPTDSYVDRKANRTESDWYSGRCVHTLRWMTSSNR